jgi:signal transduction histidine kinase
MSRIFSKLTSFSKISAVMVCIASIGYVGYLVVAHYQAQVALQESQRQQLIQESDRRASAASYFFSAQLNALTELSEAREISIYFENQALGMSLEYGLNASLASMQELFDKFTRKSRLERHQVYSRVLFLTPDGRALALSGDGTVASSRPEWSRFVRRKNKMYFLTDTQQGDSRIIISLPCIFKEKLVGQVLGIIPLSLVYAHFVGSPEGSSEILALSMADKYLFLPAKQKGVLPPPLQAAPPRLPAGVLTPLKSAGKPEADLLATRTDIAGTPLSIIDFIPAGKFDMDHPRRILMATAVMALAILIGMFLVFVLTTRNTILKTRLEEAGLREREAEELNRTLERRVQEEIEKSREKDLMVLQNEKLASIGQLAAGVAHEINNPMGFITSNLRRLTSYFADICTFVQAQRTALEQTATPEQLQELATTEEELDLPYLLEDGADLIKESLTGAERVARIVRDLRSFSRIDSPEYDVADLTVCLESALTIVYNDLKYEATVLKEIEPLPPISCHPGQLNQVFMNILINARQAITPPGTITLKSWYDEEFVFVSVGDNGHGIPENVRDRIFEPFFTTRQVGQGIGLGLSVTRDIITKHGGEILVESSGEGTTFTVKLPRTTEKKS